MSDIVSESVHSFSYSKSELSGLDFLFGLSRAEWVFLFKETIDIDRMCSALEQVLEQFPVASGRLVKRDNRFYIEQLDAGVHLEVIDSESPSPNFGPDVYPVLANGLVPDFPRVLVEELESQPLSAFRFTRYSDGRVTLGLSFCHALADGGSIFAFINAWHCAYSNEPIVKPALDRSLISKLGKDNVEAPTALSGLMPKPFNPELFAGGPPVSDFFGMHLTEAEHVQLAERVKQEFAGAVSFNDYLQAMVLKVFAQSCQDEGDKTTHANMTYDLRRMRTGQVPMTYFGGATLYRSFPASFNDLRNGDVRGIAQRFKELGRPDAEVVQQDIGYCQAQYEAGNTNVFGAFSEFLTPLLNKGLYINNMLGLGRPQFSFGNNVIWGEMPLRAPFAIRKALFIANRAGGVSIRMVLPIGQKELFLAKWAECVKQELPR